MNVLLNISSTLANPSISTLGSAGVGLLSCALIAIAGAGMAIQTIALFQAKSKLKERSNKEIKIHQIVALGVEKRASGKITGQDRVSQRCDQERMMRKILLIEAVFFMALALLGTTLFIGATAFAFWSGINIIADASALTPNLTKILSGIAAGSAACIGLLSTPYLFYSILTLSKRENSSLFIKC